MAVTLFDLMAKLTLDTSGFDTNASKAVSQAGGMTSSLEGMTARAVAMGNAMYSLAVNAAQAAWNFGVDLVQTAAEVQAEQAQFASVFAGVEDQAWGVFDRIGTLANIHTGRLMTLGTGIYTQFASAGMESADAMAAMEQTMMLAADAAAFYDISLEDAAHMVRSFLRGNVEAGESIGLFANDVLRTQYAAEMYGAKWAELNELQRESVLLAIAQDTYDQANATGQAAREADNYTNVLNNLRETWRQIKAVLGEPILNAVIPVIQELEKFLKDNPELVEKFASGIGVIASALSDAFVWLLQFVGEHSDEILSFIEGIASFLGFAPTSAEREAADVATAYTGATVSPDQVSGFYSEIPSLVMDMIRAADRFYDLDYSDDATNAEINAAHSEFQRLWSELLVDMTSDQQRAMEAWMESSGIRDEDSSWRLNQDGTIPEGVIESLPSFVMGIVNDMMSSMNELPATIAAALPGALSGVQVVLNDNIVGVVAAGMQRNANAKRFTL